MSDKKDHYLYIQFVYNLSHKTIIELKFYIILQVGPLSCVFHKEVFLCFTEVLELMVKSHMQNNNVLSLNRKVQNWLASATSEVTLIRSMEQRRLRSSCYVRSNLDHRRSICYVRSNLDQKCFVKALW